MKKRSRVQLSVETEKLINFLKNCAQSGETATYKDMSRLLGRSVQGPYRSNLSSALLIVRREYGFVFKCLTNEGYEPISYKNIATEVTAKRRKRINSETVSWRNELETVPFPQLKGESLKKYLTAVTLVSTQEIINSEKFEKKTAQITAKNYQTNGLEWARTAAKSLIDVS